MRNNVSEHICAYILNHPNCQLDYKQIANDLQIPYKTIYNTINKLLKDNTIKKIVENGSSMVVVNRCWKDVYIEQLEQMLIQTHYITEDKLNQFKSIIKEQYRE